MHHLNPAHSGYNPSTMVSRERIVPKGRYYCLDHSDQHLGHDPRDTNQLPSPPQRTHTRYPPLKLSHHNFIKPLTMLLLAYRRNGYYHRLFKNMFSVHRFITRLNHYPHCIPQGSVLCSLLYSIYINDIKITF